jgi:phosphohistidine phosphatase
LRRIWLLRHAKSDWNQPGVPDHDRTLNKRGKRSAKEVAETVRREGIRPDVVLVSSAKRAQETAEKLGVTLTKDAALYNAAAADLVTRLRALPDDAQSVMLVGHNPGMEDLAAQFGDDDGSRPLGAPGRQVAGTVQRKTWPAFTGNATPVQARERSLAKKRIVFATSAESGM